MLYGQGWDTPLYRAYLRSCEEMVGELCGRYGELLEFWVDGGVMPPEGGGPDVLPIFEKYQPRGMFYHSRQRADHRWAGAEDGRVGDPCWSTITDVMSQYDAHGDAQKQKTLLRHGDPEGRAWVPAMADAPIRNHNWFWRADETRLLRPAEELTAMYFASVGRNANLVLGLIPGGDGLIPEADAAVCREFGRQARAPFATPAGETSGRGATLELRLPKPSRVDTVIVMEDIATGQRVREFVVEGLAPGGQWVELARGESVGYKRIERLAGRDLVGLRIRATRSPSVPAWRKLAAFTAG